MAGQACVSDGKNRECIQNFGKGFFLEKQPFGSLRRRWGNNIKMDLTKIAYDGGRRVDIAEDCVQ
jgi:hypothetical protein